MEEAVPVFIFRDLKSQKANPLTYPTSRYIGYFDEKSSIIGSPKSRLLILFQTYANFA